MFHFPFAPRLLESLQLGRRNVHELIDVSHAAKFEACKILAILLEQGAVEPVSIADLQRFAQESSTGGDHAQAAKFLSRVVDLGGATPAVNMSLGYALEAVEEPEKASLYFKAAADAYVEAMEPSHAYEALIRVSRALPTDLPAVTRLVELACNHPELLAANRHEVVEAGRVLAQCLRELGRLPAAIQVLHKLAQGSPQDLTLRNMLVQAYQDAGLNNEAAGELEAMADQCIRTKNFEEAIRCLRRVLAIDRTRAGVQKRIESLTQQRDSGKRLVLKIVAALAILGSVGLGAYGFLFLRQQKFREEEESRSAISAVLDPLQSRFVDAEKAFHSAHEGLEEFGSLGAERVIEGWSRMDSQVGVMKASLDELRRQAATLHAEHAKKGNLSASFVEDRAAPLTLRLRAVEEQKKTLQGRIVEAQGDAFSNHYEAALVRPLDTIPKARKVLQVLEGIGASTEYTLKGSKEDVRDFVRRLEGYKAEIAKTQQEANRLWEEGKRRESHDHLSSFLGSLSIVEEFAEILRFRIHLTSVPGKAQVRVLQGPGQGGPPIPLPASLEYTAASGIQFEVVAEGFLPASRQVSPLKAPFREVDLRRLLLEDRIVLKKVPVWSASLGAGGVDAPPIPATDGKTVIVADRSGWIHALSLPDGRKVHSYDAKSPSGFPGGALVTADSVFAASADGDGVVLALDFPGLKERWRKADPEGVGAVYGTPILHEGALVVAGESGVVKAYDPGTGSALWETRLPAGTRLPVLAARGWIVVFCEDGAARAVAPGGASFITVLPTSREQGSYPPLKTRPLTAAEKVLFGPEGLGSEFSLVELPVPGAATPHIGYRWGASREGAEPSGAVLAGAEEILLLFSDGHLVRASVLRGVKPGEPARRVLPEKEKPVGAPVQSGDLLIVASERGLAAVRLGTGAPVEAWSWTAPADTTLTTPPVVCGKLVLAGTADGKVHALLIE